MSSMRISFLAPRLPPAVCGVADHTRLLADEMHGQGAEVAFIHCDAALASGASLPGPVNRWTGGSEALESYLAQQQADWLWVQFSNYGYSRWGAPYSLGRDLRSVRRRMPGVRLAIYLHETHCLPRQLGFKGPILSRWQRHTVAAVTRLGDLAFVSVAPYERRVIDEYGVDPSKVFRLPIGSNIPPANLTPEERSRQRRNLGWADGDVVGVIFGAYPTQVRALRRFQEVIVRGIRAGILQRVVCVGGDGPVTPPELLDLVDRFSAPEKFEILGPRPAEEVGRILNCCDFAFSPTPRHVLEKSGAFLACAFAGLAVLVYAAPKIEPSDDLPVLPAESWDWRQASSTRVTAIRAALKKRAFSSYTWENIAERALSYMAAVKLRHALVET